MNVWHTLIFELHVRHECLSECPETTTIVGRECKDCEKPCYTCSGNISNCTYCIAGNHLFEN